jgi:hypothetical protein
MSASDPKRTTGILPGTLNLSLDIRRVFIRDVAWGSDAKLWPSAPKCRQRLPSSGGQRVSGRKLESEISMLKHGTPRPLYK